MRVKTDKAVYIVTGTTLLTFLIINRVGTIGLLDPKVLISLLYPNVLIAAILFVYFILQADEDVPLLSSSTVFGVTTVLTYVPMDWLFSRKVGLVVYRSDFFREYNDTYSDNLELGGVRNLGSLLLSTARDGFPNPFD